jgi:hypothetical protein
MPNNIINRVKARQASFNMPLNQEVTMNADGSGGPISINKQTKYDVSWNDPGLQNYSKNTGKSMKSVVKDYNDSGGFSKAGHMVLDGLGMVPGVGAFADLINAGWYALEGDAGNSTMSLLAAVPGMGQGVTATKYGAKGVKALLPNNMKKNMMMDVKDMMNSGLKGFKPSWLDIGFGSKSLYDDISDMVDTEKSKSEGSVEEENYNLENKGENQEKTENQKQPENINYQNNQRPSNRSKSFGQAWIDANRKKFNK